MQQIVGSVRFDKLDLNLLVVLDALLTTRSVTRAAQRVFLSQPATSLSLKRLREYFKDALLQPVGKSFVLTPLAAELAKPVRDVLLQIQTISHLQPAFDPARSQRRFVIDASDYVISVFLSEMIRRAACVAPDVEFDLRARSPQSRALLQRGEIELLVTPQFALVPGQPSELLFEDTFSCLVSPEYFGTRKKLTTAQYFDASHIGVQWGGQLLTYDQQLISVGKRVRKQDVIAPSFMLVPQLLVGTARIATLPTRLARQIATRFSLRVVKCPVHIPPFAEYMQWHKYQEWDPAIVWLRGSLLEITRQMHPAPPEP